MGRQRQLDAITVISVLADLQMLKAPSCRKLRCQELSGAQLIGESLATLSGEGVDTSKEVGPKLSVQLTADFDKWHVFFAGERLDGEARRGARRKCREHQVERFLSKAACTSRGRSPFCWRRSSG